MTLGLKSAILNFDHIRIILVHLYCSVNLEFSLILQEVYKCQNCHSSFISISRTTHFRIVHFPFACIAARPIHLFEISQRNDILRIVRNQVAQYLSKLSFYILLHFLSELSLSAFFDKPVPFSTYFDYSRRKIQAQDIFH